MFLSSIMETTLRQFAKGKKPTVGFFGMIYFGGSEPMLATALQRLATQKISKNRQNSKSKLDFYFPKHRF